MQVNEKRDRLIERRQLSMNETVCWEQLTLAQHFSASSLASYGYHLSFIRSAEAGSTAVFYKDGKVLTIGDNGDINTSPNIHLRG